MGLIMMKRAFAAILCCAAVSGVARSPLYCPADQPREAWSDCFQELTFPNGVRYAGEFRDGKPDGQGRFEFANGNLYEGSFRNGVPNGFGTFAYINGNKYVGEWQDERAHGRGLFTFSDGRAPLEGIWRRDEFVRAETIPDSLAGRASSGSPPAVSKTLTSKNDQTQSTVVAPMSVTTTEPDSEGLVTININANTDIVSLRIGGTDFGSSESGRYSVRLFTQVGQNNLEIVAVDRFGKIKRQPVSINRVVNDQALWTQPLRPNKVAAATQKDAVAIIIGIEKYRRVPTADFANKDASVFYDYARRALGVKQENIKLLLDDKADAAEILVAFKNWLPTRVSKGKTDVYVFYSGHGLPSEDGNSLYFLPHEANRDLLDRTAIAQKELVDAIQRSSPKTVTMFIDSCYSGQSRTGETLLASARPIAVTAKQTSSFPSNFTVISASAPDQISSSSPELKHGIFSYYLMRGMEGEADANKDKQITVAEMQAYLSENVSRRAMGMNRTQQPQVIGDQTRVLVGR